MTTLTDADIEWGILSRLNRKDCWGGRHTAIEHLQGGFPSHLTGRAKQVALELLKRGWLIRKPTFYGLHVSLNPRFRAEILARISGPEQT